MKIIAASIAKATGSFLHAGYGSTAPRPLEQGSYPSTVPLEQLDVAEALRLKGEVLASSASLSDSATPLLAAGELTTLALVGATLIGLLSLFYLLRHRFVGTLQPAVPVMAMLALALLVRCGEEPLPTEPPWEGVELKQYEDPEAATKVLLYGIIYEAMGCMHRKISTLPNIQHEARLPAARLTQGQAYALQTYGIDGWGREFRLEVGNAFYTITSAGADGSFGTSDDLDVNMYRPDQYDWHYRERSFYLREDSAGSLMVFFQRWTGDFFRYRNRDKARQMTGDDTFDLFDERNLDQAQLASASQAFEQMAEGKTYSPMVLQVFTVD